MISLQSFEYYIRLTTYSLAFMHILYIPIIMGTTISANPIHVYVLPASLTFAAIFVIASDGLSIGSVVIGLLAMSTLGTVAYVAYVVFIVGGSIFGGTFAMLGAGNVLAIALIAQAILHRLVSNEPQLKTDYMT